MGTSWWFCLQLLTGCSQDVSQSCSYLRAGLPLGGPIFWWLSHTASKLVLPPHADLSELLECPQDAVVVSPQ